MTTPQLTLDGMAARIRELEALVYVPGLWRCAKCGAVEGYVKIESSGLESAACDLAGKKCRIDGSPLWRVTWKENAQRLGERLRSVQREGEAA